MFAIDKPAVEAIFSPATDATEKSILKRNPTESPMPISERIITINLKLSNSKKLGTFTLLKMKKVMHIDITILICMGINAVEKNGELMSNEPIRKDTKKKTKIN